MPNHTPSPLEKLFGNFNWQAPFWLRDFREHPKKLTGPLILLIILGVLAYGLTCWLKQKPDPSAIIVAATTPNLSEIADSGIYPAPAKIDFSKSALRLEFTNKSIDPKLIKITPPLPGSWDSSEDNQLTFLPKEDWPAGTRYHVTLDKGLFAEQAKLAKYDVEFTTRPFTARFEESKFYINPTKPDEREITATLYFDYPVSQQALEKALTIEGKNTDSLLEHKAGTPLFTVKMADFGRTAYIRSTQVKLSDKPDYVYLTLPKGFAPVKGQGLKNPVRSEVLIPDRYSMLKVSSANFTVVNNDKGDPQQTLILQTTVGVKSQLIQQNLSVYLLPERKPANEDQTTDEETKKTDHWQGPGEVTDAVLAESQKLSFQLNPAVTDEPELHSLTLQLPPGRYIYLKLNKDITGLGGFVLKNDFVSVLPVPQYPKEVEIMADGSLLALSGERKLSIKTRGLARVEFRLGKVSSSEINHLVSQSEGSFQSPNFQNQSFGEDNISKVFYKTITTDNADPTKANYLALDFKEMLGAYHTDARGLFFLEAADQPSAKTTPERLNDMQRPDPDPYNSTWNSQDRDNKVKDRRFILITDLGIIVKNNADGTHAVFVQSIKTGEPIAGAKVTVIGKNGEPVAEASTDNQGHANIPRVSDLQREKRPVAFLVQKGDDLSFLPFNRADRMLNFSRYDIDGRRMSSNQQLGVFMFTERGLYRPGDEVHLAMIAKQYDWSGNLDGLPLEMEISSPTSDTVAIQKLKLNHDGFITTSFQTRETSKTGTYYAGVYFVNPSGKRERMLGSTTFRVEEFLPDRLKIKAALNVTSTAGWVSPKDLQLQVNLQNLYGAAATGNRVNADLTLEPTSYDFAKYPDYTFYDPDSNLEKKPQQHQATLPDGNTDDHGNATLKLNIDHFEKGVYQLNYFVRGFEKEGGRNVSTAGETLVSGREYLVGSKPDGALDYVRMGSDRQVSFIAISPDLQPRNVDHLRMKLTEIRYVSVLMKNQNGNYSYQSVPKENPISEQEVSIGSSGYHYALPTKEPGSYVARLMDEHNDCLSVVRFKVVGNANLTRSLEKNAELQLQLSKEEYRDGEEIQMSLTSPYTGSGLITIEQDQVYSYKWFHTTTTSSTQSITLPGGLEGNAYVTVTFVRSPESTEIFTSPLCSAVASFKINRDKRTTKIELNTPDKAVPGKPFTISYRTDRPSKILIYAVDEGILQVARYKTPDPLDYFLEKRALQVRTSQILDLILPEYSIIRQVAAAGGDGEEEPIAAGLNPFKRKSEAPVVYWSGIIDAGPEERSVTYDVPDYFNGTLHVFAVAVSPDATNSADRKSFIQAPLIIQPNVPTFVAPGDEFEVTASVANNIENSGANTPVKLDLNVSGGLQVVESATAAVTIPEGKDASYRYKLKATEALGNAELHFSAAASTVTAKYTATTSVRPPSAFLARINGGYFTGKKEIAIERQLYPQYRNLQVSTSLLPLGLTWGLKNYLDNYPYLCTEQLTSRAFPTLLLDEDFGVKMSHAEREQNLAKIIDILRTRQNSAGAFGLWQAADTEWFSFPSIYAMHFLTEAKENGYEVPGDLFRRGLAYLEANARDHSPDSLVDARQQAYAIYILTRNQVITTNYLDRLISWLNNSQITGWNNDVTGLYCAASYALMHNDSDANKILAGFKLNSPPKLADDDDYYSELNRKALYLYMIARHFPAKLQTVSANDLLAIVEPVANNNYVTYSAAYTILGLKNYADAMRSSGGLDAGVNKTISVEQKLANGTQSPIQLSDGFCPSGSFSLDAKSLLIKNSGSGRVFYQVMEAGFDLQPSAKILKNGLEIERQYLDRSGKVVTSAKLGEELTVRIKVRSTSLDYINDVAITDLLPGGCEVVPNSIRGTHDDDDQRQTNQLEPDYVDIREDRIIVHATVSKNALEFNYRILTTNGGTYRVPPVQAEALYDRNIQARGQAGSFVVNP